MSRAADHGGPKIRVRRVDEVGRWIFRRGVYEIEFTELGGTSPSWVCRTTDPAGALRPWYGLADGYAVQASADSLAVGTWTSLHLDDA